MSEHNTIRLINYDDAKFRRLNTEEKLKVLISAEETNYENFLKLQKQRAKIYQLQSECNEKKLVTLERRHHQQQQQSLQVVQFVEDKEDDRKKRKESARARAREIESDMTQKRMKFDKSSHNVKK